MKYKASTYMKHAFAAIVMMVKAKTMALKRKASAMKTRLLLFRLLHNKKILMRAISYKIHALMHQDSKATVLYNAEKVEASPSPNCIELAELKENDDYPDLRHSLFDEDDDDEVVNGTGSVVDLVRNSREDDSDFRLEDEIDHVADMFIRRFYRQMKMQKLESFKRYREMLERGV